MKENNKKVLRKPWVIGFIIGAILSFIYPFNILRSYLAWVFIKVIMVIIGSFAYIFCLGNRECLDSESLEVLGFLLMPVIYVLIIFFNGLIGGIIGYGITKIKKVKK